MYASSYFSPLPVLFAIALALTGCGGGGDGGTPTAGPTPALTALAVSPNGQIDTIGATRQFTATATYDDGSTGDVTGNVTWTSSKPEVATVNTTGVATAVGASSATLTATHADSGQSASVT
jgi:uncharacterized protein YjdB